MVLPHGKVHGEHFYIKGKLEYFRLCVVTHTCSPSTWETEEGVSQVSPSYKVRSCLKKQTNKKIPHPPLTSKAITALKMKFQKKNVSATNK
jgi:hypothetical protein